MTGVLVTLVVLAALVAIHAAGHVVAATACGLEVPVVAVGFGPVLFYVIIRGTENRLCSLPFAGHVSIPELERVESTRSSRGAGP